MSVRYAVPPIVTNGLVLYLDAANRQSYVSGSTTWFDATANGLSGSLTNGPTFSSANAGSLVFDGTNDNVIISSSLFNKVNGQEITVSCWIKPNRLAGQYQVFCSNRSDDSNIYNWIFYQHTNDGAIGFHGGFSQYKSNYIPTVNVWINATNTVTTSGVSTLYINGISTYVVNGYQYGGIPSKLGIGANPGFQEAYQGNISSVAIHNRALSVSEILQNYNSTKARFGL